MKSKITSLNDALVVDLLYHIQGEVYTDVASRALYATDASNYRQVPIAVAIPRTVEDMVMITAVARQYKVPLLPRGAGTSLAGQACNTALVVDTSKYLNRVLRVDPVKQLAWVEPGTILDDLQNAVKPYQLIFAPDPATHSRCTLGGMIGNNACGAHSVMAGKTVDNIESLEILTYDGLRLKVGATSEEELASIIQAGGKRGELYARLRTLRDVYASQIREKFPSIPRRVSGYNLDMLLPENGFHVARALVGTEGTCVTVLQAVTHLVPCSPQQVLLVLGFNDIYEAGDQTSVILQHKPLCLEGLDADMIVDMRKKQMQLKDIALLPKGGAWLLIEFGGNCLEEATEKARTLIAALEGHWLDYRLLVDNPQQQQMWALRENGSAATNSVPGEAETYPGWEDAAVDPHRMGDYLRDFRQLLNRYGYRASLYGHFGDGCVHARITFDLRTTAGIAKWRAYLEEAADLVVQYGGSLSGEHGDGHARAALLPKMFGSELMHAFAEFKTIWDPNNCMNPGKIVHPYAVDEHLRLGPDCQLSEVETYFSFPQDQGSFAKATSRCIGVGKCRRNSGEVMCPSYQSTHEERYATRGRAHLLFEMLRGELITDNWDNSTIYEALDYCLSCKSCKRDCPVGVNMATYKAEFMAHYYENHARPRHTYSMGLIHRWAPLATHIPNMINFCTQTPVLSRLAKWIAGIARERQIPRFAEQNFRQWAKQRVAPMLSPKLTHTQRLKTLFRHPVVTSHPDCILWVDTANNYFRPQSLIAALQVLETCGYRVKLSPAALCCGRPLYDSGRLSLARELLQDILDTLGDDILAGTPVVGLEPSCVSVFKDELINLFPNDPRAKKLSEQTLLFSEFLSKTPQLPLAPPATRAVVHGHCHQKAIFSMDNDLALLKRLGIDARLINAGCCGMAGSFGFQPNKYAMSMRLAETTLIPAIWSEEEDVLLIADGFSCCEQIRQSSRKQPLHLAEVVFQVVSSQ